jgi:hypothetical protein
VSTPVLFNPPVQVFAVDSDIPPCAYGWEIPLENQVAHRLLTAGDVFGGFLDRKESSLYPALLDSCGGLYGRQNAGGYLLYQLGRKILNALGVHSALSLRG